MDTCSVKQPLYISVPFGMDCIIPCPIHKKGHRITEKKRMSQKLEL